VLQKNDYSSIVSSKKLTNHLGFFCLVLQVDSARKHGILLEAVQVLTDLNLSIKKAYISSDGRWFMDGKLFVTSAASSLLIFHFGANVRMYPGAR
jgi:predicted regulator of amino acid metabolism with ACT domain